MNDHAKLEVEESLPVPTVPTLPFTTPNHHGVVNLLDVHAETDTSVSVSNTTPAEASDSAAFTAAIAAVFDDNDRHHNHTISTAITPATATTTASLSLSSPTPTVSSSHSSSSSPEEDKDKENRSRGGDGGGIVGIHDDDDDFPDESPLLFEEDAGDDEHDPTRASDKELIRNAVLTTDLERALAATIARKDVHIAKLIDEITKLRAFIRKRKQSYKRKRKNDGAPTRALSAYNMFIKERFAQLAKRNEEALKSTDSDATLKRVQPSNLVTVTGNEWKELSAEVKAKYEERAKEDRKRYETEMAQWQPPDKNHNRKRNKTGYNMFFSSHVVRLKASVDGVPGLRGSVARMVGNAWKQLSGEEKQYFEREADEYNGNNTGNSSTPNGSASRSETGGFDDDDLDKIKTNTQRQQPPPPPSFQQQQQQQQMDLQQSSMYASQPLPALHPGGQPQPLYLTHEMHAAAYGVPSNAAAMHHLAAAPVPHYYTSHPPSHHPHMTYGQLQPPHQQPPYPHYDFSQHHQRGGQQQQHQQQRQRMAAAAVTGNHHTHETTGAAYSSYVSTPGSAPRSYKYDHQV